MGERAVERPEHDADDDAARYREHGEAAGGLVGAVAVTGAEHPPDHHLARDRERVEHEREQVVELERDLVGAERRLADPREHGAGDDEREIEGARPHGDLDADAR